MVHEGDNHIDAQLLENLGKNLVKTYKSPKAKGDSVIQVTKV